jgi:pimeloyl-ACP methyl ester carboxylesterase
LVASGINGWETKFNYDSTVTKYLSSFFGSIENKDSVRAAEIFTQTWFDGPYRTPQQVNDSARRYIYETTLANIRSHKVRGWPIFAEPPAIVNLSKIKNPVLVIHGDKDMPLISSTSAYLEKTIPGAKRIMIPNTGHMLNMEAPAEFNKAVIDFLD